MPGKGARAWPYFTPGQEVSGLRVAELLVPGEKKHETVYRVILVCCEDEREMTHTAIDKRARKGNTECSGCTQRRLAREMGKNNSAEAKAARDAVKRAQQEVVIEAGPWAGRYSLFGPMGHRYGNGYSNAVVGTGG